MVKNIFAKKAKMGLKWTKIWLKLKKMANIANVAKIFLANIAIVFGLFYLIENPSSNFWLIYPEN